LTEDQLKHEEQAIQRSTDKYIALIDDLIKLKEKELMEV
jgi:ribosome recycling factor